MLIEEMLQPAELDRLLRDSFANYVIQTALDYANPPMKNRLVEAIRPHLPAIRTTPYGRRIQAKIQGSDGRSGQSSGQQTPNDVETSQVPLRHQRGMSNVSTSGFTSPVSTYTNGFSPVSTTPNSNGLPVSSAGPGQSSIFPSSDRLALTPNQQQSYQYGFGRGGNQTGPNNWL